MRTLWAGFYFLELTFLSVCAPRIFFAHAPPKAARADCNRAFNIINKNADITETKRRPSPDQAQAFFVFCMCFMYVKYANILYSYLISLYCVAIVSIIKIYRMATYTDGINGNFKGKVGRVIGSSWKGKPYMKSLYRKRTIPAHEMEQLNRNKFALAHRWLQPVTDFVRAGYKGHTPTVEGFLAAKSYLLKNAFEGDGADMVINPALMKVSYGDLPLPENLAAVKSAPNELQVSWKGSDKSQPDAYDQVMILAYDIENGESEETITGQFRYVGTDTLEITAAIPERTYHIYAAFIAADRSCQSMSVYLGTISY
jgi:hypothetical protein